MKILSIETSCDDTSITVFEASGSIQNANFKILANSSNSQVKIHTKYGGVYPMLAKREHIKNLPILLEKTLKEAKLKSLQGRTLFSRFEENPGIDLIAVTYGPGLEPSLWSGIVFSKKMAKTRRVPLISVNPKERAFLSGF